MILSNAGDRGVTGVITGSRSPAVRLDAAKEEYVRHLL
jgi:hypothetical protein